MITEIKKPGYPTWVINDYDGLFKTVATCDLAGKYLEMVCHHAPEILFSHDHEDGHGGTVTYTIQIDALAEFLKHFGYELRKV